MDQTNAASKDVIRAWLKRNVTPDQKMSMIETPPPASRLELVKVWLEDNVFVPPTPRNITISDIRFDWRNLHGSFRLALDNCLIKDAFDVAIDIAGNVKFAPPMYHSPLGAPASYAAVELNLATSSAVIRALERVFPKLRGFGLHKDIGIEIWADSPVEDRIPDLTEFHHCQQLLSRPGFSVNERIL